MYYLYYVQVCEIVTKNFCFGHPIIIRNYRVALAAAAAVYRAIYENHPKNTVRVRNVNQAIMSRELTLSCLRHLNLLCHADVT